MSISGKLLELTPGIDDLTDIIYLDLNHFPRPWDPTEWSKLNPDNFLLYAWQNIGLDGFALFQRVTGDETAHLLKICIDPNHRGKGLAQKLWDEIKQKLRSLDVKSVYLEVEKTNLNALKFYQKSGFLPLREIKAYYSDGTSAMTMSLTL